MERQSRGVLDTSLALARGMTAHLEQRGRAFARPGGGLLPAGAAQTRRLGEPMNPFGAPALDLSYWNQKWSH